MRSEIPPWWRSSISGIPRRPACGSWRSWRVRIRAVRSKTVRLTTCSRRPSLPESWCPGKTILEPTSGNTGIGMAMVAAAMGYKIKLTMPTCVSQERQAVLQALGAELELTPGSDRTDGAIRRAHHIMEYQGDIVLHAQSVRQSLQLPGPLPYDRAGDPAADKRRGRSLRRRDGNDGHADGLLPISSRRRSRRSRSSAIEPTLNHRIQGLKNMQEAIVPKIYDPSRLDQHHQLQR